ncbi:MAG: hypothetical protein SV377_05450 [Halobacteria archaeon]|nr:hypothetical protein [Halobacteria archaeon]
MGVGLFSVIMAYGLMVFVHGSAKMFDNYLQSNWYSNGGTEIILGWIVVTVGFVGLYKATLK